MPLFSLAPRQPRRSQPLQPTANPAWIARGMVALFDCRAGREVISGDRAITNSTALLGRSDGVTADFSGVLQQVYAHRPSYVLTGAMAVAVYCDLDSLTEYSFVAGKQATNTTHGWELRLGAGPNDSNLQFGRANGSGISLHDSAVATTSAPRKRLLLVFSSPNSVIEAVNKTFWADGAKFALRQGYTTGSGWPSDNGANLHIGRRVDNSTQFDGGIYYVALFNREWNDGLHTLLNANRWDLFLGPRARQPWYGPAAAALAGLGALAARARAMLLWRFFGQPAPASYVWSSENLPHPGGALSNGNRRYDIAPQAYAHGSVRSAAALSGDVYVEVAVTSVADNLYRALGVTSATGTVPPGGAGVNAMVYGPDNCASPAGEGGFNNDAAFTADTRYRFAEGDRIRLAFRASTKQLWIGRNGSWLSGDPAAGGAPTLTCPQAGPFYWYAGWDGCDLTADPWWAFELMPPSSHLYAPPPGFSAAAP